MRQEWRVYTHMQFYTVHLCLGGRLSLLLIIKKHNLSQQSWPPCFKSFRRSLSTLFLTLNPNSKMTELLLLISRWIVIHSKSIIKVLIYPFFSPISTKNCQKITFYYYYLEIIALEGHDLNNQCLKQWLQDYYLAAPQQYK